MSSQHNCPQIIQNLRGGAKPGNDPDRFDPAQRTPLEPTRVPVRSLSVNSSVNPASKAKSALPPYRVRLHHTFSGIMFTNEKTEAIEVLAAQVAQAISGLDAQKLTMLLAAKQSELKAEVKQKLRDRGGMPFATRDEDLFLIRVTLQPGEPDQWRRPLLQIDIFLRDHLRPYSLERLSVMEIWYVDYTRLDNPKAVDKDLPTLIRATLARPFPEMP